jgi:hypothetical protein
VAFYRDCFVAGAIACADAPALATMRTIHAAAESVHETEHDRLGSGIVACHRQRVLRFAPADRPPSARLCAMMLLKTFTAGRPKCLAPHPLSVNPFSILRSCRHETARR